MSVSSTITQVEVTLTAPLQTVSIPFVFFDDSDLVVLAAGVLKTLTTHYTVTGGNGSTGSITMTAAGPSTGLLLCYRSIPNTHTLDLTQGGPMPPEEIEKSLDRLTYIAQQLSALLAIAVRYAPGTAAQDALTLGTVPAVVGTTGNGATSMLTIDQLVELLNVDGSLVDRPTKTFADSAAMSASVPDFVGQVGTRLDLITSPRLACLYVATAATAGSWSVFNITTASIPDLAITTAKLNDLCVTAAKIAALTITAAQVAEATLTRSKTIAADRPAQVFANNAARTAATPDFIGQLAVQVDLIASPRMASIYIGSAVSAGSWVVLDITTASVPDLAITTAKVADLNITAGKLALNSVTNDKVLDGNIVGSKLYGAPFMRRSDFFLSSGTAATFTPSTGARALLARVWGAGAGGGGSNGVASQVGFGMSGGGGGYSEVFITDMTQVFKYTIGAAGVGGAAGSNPGTAGGDSTFFGGVAGATARAIGGGGNGGAAGTAGTVPSVVGVGAAAGQGTIGLINFRGSRGGPAGRGSGTIPFPGSKQGDAPFIGGGRSSTENNTGVAADTYGCGGGGAVVTTATARAGGDGFAGLIIITEFF